jgi:hypothetical protein
MWSEHAWVIEKSQKDHYSGPLYYAMSVELGDEEYWTTDPYKAVRFARQQDAQDVMRGFNISLAAAVEREFDERYKVRI